MGKYQALLLDGKTSGFDSNPSLFPRYGGSETSLSIRVRYGPSPTKGRLVNFTVEAHSSGPTSLSIGPVHMFSVISTACASSVISRHWMAGTPRCRTAKNPNSLKLKRVTISGPASSPWTLRHPVGSSDGLYEEGFEISHTISDSIGASSSAVYKLRLGCHV